jgi:CheY-like chemotaxis protein
MLVIEDEKIDALSVSGLLSQHFPDVKLEILNNGEQALDWVHKFRPDPDEKLVLIFMDLTLPRMSGFDLISQFKANIHLRVTPIVILSANDSPQAIKSAYDSGASGYVVKPDALAQMRDLLKKTLDYWIDVNRLAQP